jgi:hypothetical protein
MKWHRLASSVWTISTMVARDDQGVHIVQQRPARWAGVQRPGSMQLFL